MKNHIEPKFRKVFRFRKVFLFSTLVGLFIKAGQFFSISRFFLPAAFKKYMKKSNNFNWFYEAAALGKDLITLPTSIRNTAEQFQTGNSRLKIPDIWRSAAKLL